jgi:hypothetical protein
MRLAPNPPRVEPLDRPGESMRKSAVLAFLGALGLLSYVSFPPSAGAG